MSIVTAKQVTDLMQGVEDFDALMWTDEEILSLSDNCAQPYFEEVLCKGKTFDYDTYTDTLDGNGIVNLKLSKTPIQEILSVLIDDEDIDLTEIYRYTNRIAYKNCFPLGLQNIIVTYKAGYEAAPKPVTEAIARLCASHIARVSGGGGDAISTSITAGPITLKEAFTAAGKYAAKISDWNSFADNVSKKYNGSSVISKFRKAETSVRTYDPRTDSYV